MSDLTLQHCRCGATWMGYRWEACNWCVKRDLINLQVYRQKLLQPEWMHNQGPKYQQLSDVDKRIWNETRGIKPVADVEKDWMNHLNEAEQAGHITADEMARVIAKWISMKNSLNGTKPGKMP